jgi:hypothetical protein
MRAAQMEEGIDDKLDAEVANRVNL